MVWLDQIKETVGLKKEEKVSFFWAAYLDSWRIALSLVKFKEGKTEILETKTETIKETDDLSGLVQILKGLVKKVSFLEKPKEIFFGVPDFWFEDGQLKNPHQKALDKLSQSAELAFSGSISVLKAILNYGLHQENFPDSLIFLEILPQKIRVIVCRHGRVESRREKEKKDSVAEALQEVLKDEFTGESLPARIVVSGAEDFEKTRKEILDSSFEETGLFLHLPKVEDLSLERLSEAIGFSVKKLFKAKRAVVFNQKESGEEKTRGELEKKEKEIEKKEKDEEKDEEDSEEKEEEKDKAEERFGFVIGEDVSRKQEKLEKKTERKIVLTPPEKKIKVPLSQLKEKFFAGVRRVPAFFSQLDFSRLPPSSFLFVGIVILVLVVLFSAYWYLPKAKVVLFVEPKELGKTFEVTIASSDFEASGSAKVLRGKQVSADFSGERSAPATGTKLTGEQGTGRVAVLNKTTSKKSFSQGTKIVGPNQLVFTLDQGVDLDPATIATSSAGETKTYGRAEVDVTAEDIGSEYNLPGGINFSIGGFSTNLYSALNSEGFSGGSSQEVTVVSEEDQVALQEELAEEFKQKAGERITSEAGEELKVFPEAVSLEIKESRFDRQAGEEAEIVNLSMDARAETLGYKPGSLKEFLAAEVEETVPEDFDLIPGQIESEEKFLRKIESAVVAEISFQVNLIPKVDLEETKKKIAGKKLVVARDYLDNLPRVAGSQISLSPPLPSFLQYLPHKTERMNFEIKPE